MDKLDLLDELTREADSAHVPELRVYEATLSNADPQFDKEVKRIAHMITTIARASKNSTQEVWQLLEKHLREKGHVNEGLLATFRKLAETQNTEPTGGFPEDTMWLKPREE